MTFHIYDWVGHEIYNQVRNQSLHAILMHLAEHPDDTMAVNTLMLLAYDGVIYRYGEYKFGNQNTPPSTIVCSLSTVIVRTTGSDHPLHQHIQRLKSVEKGENVRIYT